jgi:uncharacterized protein (TIRG00374 family)
MNKKVVQFLIKLIISAGLLIFLFSRIDIAAVGKVLIELQPKTLLIVFCFQITFIFLYALRWWVLLPEQSYKNILVLTMIGTFYSTVIPGQIAGDVIKAYKLGREEKMLARSAGSVFLLKYLGLVVLSLFAFLGLLFTKYSMPLVFLVFFAAAFAGAVLVYVLFSSAKIKNVILLKLKTFPAKAKIIKTISEKLISVIENNLVSFPLKKIILHIIITGAASVVTALQGMVLFLNFGFFVSPLDFFWIGGVSAIIGLVPLTVAGLGLKQLSSVGLFGLLGISPETALAYSFAGVFFSLIIVLLCGAVTLYDSVKNHKG